LRQTRFIIFAWRLLRNVAGARDASGKNFRYQQIAAPRCKTLKASRHAGWKICADFQRVKRMTKAVGDGQNVNCRGQSADENESAPFFYLF
jgi:hypothetical protein